MEKFINKHGRLIAILAPAIIGAIYIILCAVNLQQSVWFDESYGAYLTRFSFGDIWSLTAADVHPPLYYFLLKIWSGIFGSTDFGMRFMSVMFGAIAIVFAWAWLKRRFGIKIAVFATLLMALSPMLIRYGQEMRMYTMAAAIIFSATFVLQLAIDTKKTRWWVIYGILVSLGMWTHYFTALIWLAHLAYLIYHYRTKIFQKNIIISYITAVALYIPWLPHFIYQSTSVQGGFWIPNPSFTTITDYFSNSFIYLSSDEITGWALVLMLAIATVFITLTIRAKEKLTLLNFMAFLPPVLLILLSIPPFKPMFIDRYIIYSSVCMSIIAGVAIALPNTTRKNIKSSASRFWQFVKKPVFHRTLIATLFIGASIFGISQVYIQGNFNKNTGGRSDAKALFVTVAALSSPGEPIISNSEWLYYDLAFYGTPENPVFFIHELVTYEWGSHDPLRLHEYGKITDLDAFLENHKTVWFVGNLPNKGSIKFPRDTWHPITEITLPVNINQADYQAIQFQRTE
jgi:hypothetical protein